MFPHAGLVIRPIPVPEGETQESYLAQLRADPDKLLAVLKEHVHGWTDLMVAHALQGARLDNVPKVTEFLEQHIKLRDQAALARAEHERTRLLMEQSAQRARVEALVARVEGRKNIKTTPEEREAQRAASLAIERGRDFWIVAHYKKSGIFRPQRLVVGPNGAARECYLSKASAADAAHRKTRESRNFHAKQARYHAAEARRIAKFLKTPARKP